MTLLRFISPCLLLATTGAASMPAADSREEIYVLRSIREPRAPAAGWCATTRTGFEPFVQDAERQFSFWSVGIRPDDGRMVLGDAKEVGELRGCFGPAGEAARQHFYAEVRLGSTRFRGKGECLALQVDTPEPGLFPVRCQLVLSGMQAPYIGGVLTTNTLTSRARFGGATDPAGYTQASIATIRLWRAR